ncbi:uncharacterized protein LOC129607708 isoform X2 [Condylostylus longicornis]|uniref:uncharacterized protein LOC129607708 isoform X2 n=1 Tax=Condylostylus longicornis TaxID=2530218 RepID=UPI00244E1CCD|nr:uncharacterized protein LOC129607708 isoform X2 [Condylostylus longicornis]
MGIMWKNIFLLLLIKSAIAGTLEVLNSIEIQIEHNIKDKPILNTSEIITSDLTEPFIYYVDPSSFADVYDEESCMIFSHNKSFVQNESYCKWIWEKHLCWPSTPAGSIIRQQCPNFSETLKNYFAERICGLNGEWIENSEIHITRKNYNSWANLSNCFKLEIWDLKNSTLEVTKKFDLIKNVTQETFGNFTTPTKETSMITNIDNESDIHYIDHLISTSIDSEYKCLSNYNETSVYNAIYCNWTWDKYLCWPLTPAGTIVRQKCPSLIGVIKDHYAERACGYNGRWIGKFESQTSLNNSNGWTNFSNCFRGEVWDLIEKCNTGGNCDEKYEIAKRTRILETTGLILSFFTLLLSLIIFFNFQSLRNSRTKIHKNLFIAMEIQVIIRLIIYFDQKITRQNVDASQLSSSGIENTPYLCEFLYFLLEYARTAMFMWMLIEGIYLHSGVTWITGTRRFPYIAYAIIGWGAPLLMTAVWEFFTVRTAIARSLMIYMSLEDRNWFQHRSSMFSGTYFPDTETQMDNSNKKSSSPRSRSNRKHSNQKKWIFCNCFSNRTLNEQQRTAVPESIIFELSEH